MSIDLSLLPDGGAAWLDGSGENPGIVLSSRVRVARNVVGYAFPTRARDGERLRLLSQVRDAAPDVPSLEGGVLVRVDELGENDRRLLHERHLLSRELAGLEPQQQPCPRIQRIERHSDGTVLVLEFWPPGHWEDNVIFPHDVYDE